VETDVVKVTLYITAYMTCAMFHIFFIIVKKNIVQKIPTEIYRVTVNLVKTGAVKATLY